MKVTLTHDGKSVELDLTAEQMTALGLKEEKNTGYERAEKYSAYYTVDVDNEVIGLCDSHLDGPKSVYRGANYYTSKELAEANARADSLMRQLRRFAAENGGIPSKKDWEQSSVSKWRIEYSHTMEKLSIVFNASSQGLGFVYFNDCNKAQEALYKFRDELIWYFTEYEAMLR